MLKNWVKLKKSKMSLCGYVATVAIACLSFLAACGGDSSSSADDNNLSEADMMVDVFDDLPPPPVLSVSKAYSNFFDLIKSM